MAPSSTAMPTGGHPARPDRAGERRAGRLAAHVSRSRLRTRRRNTCAGSRASTRATTCATTSSRAPPTTRRSAGRFTRSMRAASPLPDESMPPSPNNRIHRQQRSIKPWTAETVKVSLEYYFERVGLVSVGAFRRDFENFFGNTSSPRRPEFLALYDLDAAHIRRVTMSRRNYNLPGNRPDGGLRRALQAGAHVPAALGARRAGVRQRRRAARDRASWWIIFPASSRRPRPGASA